MGREVVVTGLGIVTPLDCGEGIDAFWKKLCKGENSIRPIKSFSTSGHKCNVGGEVAGFESYLNDPFFKEHDRCLKLFALACKQALEASKLNPSSERIGITFGTILGGIESGEEYLDSLFLNKTSRKKNLLNDYSVNSIPAYIAKRWHLSGPNISVNTACSSSADALGIALNEIKQGRIDVMLAGGADVLSEFVFQGFSALDALTKDGLVRPFDKNRTGLALSEGAGVMLLEEREHALKRKANIYAQLIGFSSSIDAYNLVRPRGDGEGLSLAINKAVTES
ncbi:MAG: beta-ketoacyl synthase N-terminal-like domain-containing protein, partial [Candidatus Poribacteria bacterium]